MATPSEKAQARNEKFLARLQRAGGRSITLSALPFDRADGKTRKQVQGRQAQVAYQFRAWAKERGAQVEVRTRSTESSVRLDGKFVGPDTASIDAANRAVARSQRWAAAPAFSGNTVSASSITKGAVTTTSFIDRRTAPPTAPEAPLLSELYVKFLNKALASTRKVNLQASSSPRPRDIERITAYYEDLVSLALENKLPVKFTLSHGPRSITLMGRHA